MRFLAEREWTKRAWVGGAFSARRVNPYSKVVDGRGRQDEQAWRVLRQPARRIALWRAQYYSVTNAPLLCSRWGSTSGVGCTRCRASPKRAVRGRGGPPGKLAGTEGEKEGIDWAADASLETSEVRTHGSRSPRAADIASSCMWRSPGSARCTMPSRIISTVFRLHCGPDSTPLLRSRARCSATRYRSRIWAGHFQ